MSEVEEIKGKLDIADVVGRYVQLKKAGTNFRGCCPFHQEKTPSFMVSPEKQIWHCFGCGRGGDIFGFMMEQEKITFPEALELLADMVGVKLEKRGRGDLAGESDLKERLLAIQKQAVEFFANQLMNTDEGRGALQYLTKRGLRPDTIKHFQIGYAPRAWDGLTRHLQKAGFNNREINLSGLVLERNGQLIDKFRSRVMFPITDQLARVVGFTGRALTDELQPKYLNSPSTPIFDKSRVLYGLGPNRDFIKSADWVVMVEGQMDMLSVWQAGVKNIVATSGTALTLEQLQLLKRFTQKLIITFDSDEAGQIASRRALGLVEIAGLTAKIALYEGHDPDEAVRQDAKAFAGALGQAKPLAEYFLSKATSRYVEGATTDKKSALDEIADIISSIAEPVERERLLRNTASVIAVSESSLSASIANRQKQVRHHLPQEEMPKATGLDSSWFEERLMGLWLAFPRLAKPNPMPEKAIFSSPLWQEVYIRWVNEYTKSDFNPKSFLDGLDATSALQTAEAALVAEEEYGKLELSAVEREASFYLQEIRRRYREIRRAQMMQEINEAEKSNNLEKLNQLLEEFRLL